MITKEIYEDLVRMAKSIVAKNSLPDKAMEYNDAVQEMIIAGIEAINKYKGKSKLSTFLYSIMKNRYLNLLIYGNYRNHARIDELPFEPINRDFYMSKWEELTKNEQTIVRDAIMLFENGADVKEIKKQFRQIYKKEWPEMQAKIRRW